jgi:HEPN domain-containing protein
MTEELIQAWLNRAADDLAVGKLALKKDYTAHSCFLAHQAFEKSLKAFLIKRRTTHPRTHKLVDLVTECSALDKTFATLLTGAIVLDQYYIPTRYPDATPGTLAEGSPSTKQAKEALRIAQDAFDTVSSLLKT